MRLAFYGVLRKSLNANQVHRECQNQHDWNVGTSGRISSGLGRENISSHKPIYARLKRYSRRSRLIIAIDHLDSIQFGNVCWLRDDRCFGEPKHEVRDNRYDGVCKRGVAFKWVFWCVSAASRHLYSAGRSTQMSLRTQALGAFQAPMLCFLLNNATKKNVVKHY